MIMKKAPKDMNAVEFVDCLINGNVLTSVPDDDSFIQLKIIKDMLTKPAPNPFTPDQLAVMREYQRSGINYVANNNNLALLFYKDRPYIESCVWKPVGGLIMTIKPSHSFLGSALCEREVLCFADYAPLEE